MNDCITTTKQSTPKPCAYFLGYTVVNVPGLAESVSLKCGYNNARNSGGHNGLKHFVAVYVHDMNGTEWQY